MDQLVKIKTCANSFEAQLIKTKLESEGIPCMIADENISALYGNAVLSFNPRILVREEDEKRALEVLNENGDL